MNPAHHGLGMASGALGQARGAPALRDLKQGERALTGAGVGCIQRQGAQIPGVVRGAATQKYLTKVQRRITLPGALFLGLVAVLPYIMQAVFPSSARAGLFLISAAGLLIVVGVVRDTFTIIETELKLHGYDENLIRG